MMEICMGPWPGQPPHQADPSPAIARSDVPLWRVWGLTAALKIVITIVTITFAHVSPALARSFTDAGGRVVELPDKIARVLPAGPPASVLVYALAPDKLVGWSREPSEREKQFLLPTVRSLPAFGRLTGQGNTASMEAVIAARPDVIIDIGTVNPTFIALADRVQARTGIPYILIDGSLAGTPESLREVGELLGVADRAGELASYAEETFRTLEQGLAKIPAADRPRVYYGRGPHGLETGLGGSINVEVLEAVGATNVAAELGEGGLVNVSVPQVAAWNPDVILAATPRFARIAKRERSWAEIAAVRSDRVYATPMLPFGWFEAPPGINRLIGIRWLETLFYPTVFQGDLRADVATFFKRFYQVDLTQTQLDDLLKDAAPTR
jgi:iron complex transport system substrate-binding protein